MSITRNQIKKIEKELKELEPRYEFMALQVGPKKTTIIEIINGEYGRRIKIASEEGQKLLKENKVKHPKGPILIFDEESWISKKKDETV